MDFAARRAKAREEAQPFKEEAARLKAEVVDLKEQLKHLRKDKADDAQFAAIEAQIGEKERAAREQEAQAADIDAAVFDLKAVNPNAVVRVDTRTAAQIVKSIEDHGRLIAEALGRLSKLLPAEPAATTTE